MTDAAPEGHEVSVPGISDETYERLRRQASLHHRTIEDEARELLDQATAAVEGANFADVIRERFASGGGLADLEFPARNNPARWAEFGS
jgi:plasmid stability protein